MALEGKSLVGYSKERNDIALQSGESVRFQDQNSQGKHLGIIIEGPHKNAKGVTVVTVEVLPEHQQIEVPVSSITEENPNELVA